MSSNNYAGFWLRFVAYLIDSIVIGAIQTIVIVPVLGMLGVSLVALDSNYGGLSEGDAIAAIIGVVSTMGTTLIIAGTIGLAYYTFMEASKYQGTLGKMALGLKVTDTNGKPLDLGKALLRNLGKIISQMVFMIGYIIAGFTDKKQALHDIIAGALVVKK